MCAAGLQSVRWCAVLAAVCSYSCCLVGESFMLLAIRSISLNSALSWSYIGLKRQYAQAHTLAAPTPPAMSRLRRCRPSHSRAEDT